MCDGIWDCDVILHEAGIPPIHTPVKVLKELNPKIKEKLFLVSIYLFIISCYLVIYFIRCIFQTKTYQQIAVSKNAKWELKTP